MEGTAFQWAALILGILGFGITWTGGVIGITRTVEKIKQDTSEKVAAASEVHAAQLSDLRAEFMREQKVQDHNFGEVGAAMRQYIANVEKEMHQIEVWGRDNFVLKDAFDKATDRIEGAIRDMAASIKSDFKDLNAKIEKKN